MSTFINNIPVSTDIFHQANLVHKINNSSSQKHHLFLRQKLLTLSFYLDVIH